MAGNPEGTDGRKQPGGNAADALTPPTMKFQNEGERTQIGSQPAAPPTIKTQRSAPSLTSEMGGGGKSTLSDVPVQDLLEERLLRDAPRIEYNNKKVPSLNKIALLSKLGQGGMGAVYYGIHPRLRNEVAVKVLPFHLAEQNPEMIRRFFREGEIAASVRSPHVVNVLDVNEEAGLFFLVMEYVPGATANQMLKARIAAGDPGMKEVEVLDICIAATAGLKAAHDGGIVHRDIKPDNIMVPYASRTTKNFNFKNAKLMDLGLARNEESGNQSLTGVQAVMGTPGYMSPEQAIDAKTADRRADVFGMGATLYALLAGRPPFRGEVVMKVLMATMHEPHETVTKARPDVSPALSELIDHCLEKKPDNRYADAEQLLRALKNCRRLLGADDDDVGAPMDSAAKMMPAGPLSGSRVGSMASQASQATMVGPHGKSVPPMTMAPGAGGAKSKTGLYVGVAAALLIAAGGGYMVFGKGKAPDDNPEKGKTGIVDPKKPPPRPETAVADALTKMHRGHIAEGKSAITDAGSDIIAEINLKAARSLDVDWDPELRKSEVELGKLIFDFKAHKDFTERLGGIEKLIAEGNLEQAQKALQALTPPTPVDVTTYTKKLNQIGDEKQKLALKGAYDKLMDEARKFEKDGDLAMALKRVKDARKVFPDDDDATAMDGKLTSAIALKDKTEKASKLFAEATAEDKKGNAEKAAKLARELLVLTPTDAKVIELVSNTSAKLGEQEKARIEEQAKQQKKKLVDENIALAEDAVGKKEFEKALEPITKLLDLDPTNTKVVALNDRAREGLAAARLERTKTKFNDTAAAATALLTEKLDLADASRDLAEATRKVDDAHKQIDDARKQIASKDIQPLDAQLKQLDASLKKRADYVANLEGASKSMEVVLNELSTIDLEKLNINTMSKIDQDHLNKASDMLDDAAGHTAKALALIPEGEKAKKTDAFVKDKKARIDAKLAAFKQQKEAERKLAAEKVNASFKTAAGLADSNKFDDAITELLKSREFAKAAQLDPKLIDDKEAEFKTRKAAYEKDLADRKAKIKTIIDDAQALAKKGDIEGALQKIAEGEPILPKYALLDQTKAELKRISEEMQGELHSAGLLAANGLNRRDVSQAARDIEPFVQKYPSRPEIKSIVAALAALKETEGTVRLADSDYTRLQGRLQTLKKRNKKGKGESELANFASALTTLKDSSKAAMEKFAAADGFKNKTLVDTITQEREAAGARFQSLRTQIEQVIDELNRLPDDEGLPIDGARTQVNKPVERKIDRPTAPPPTTAKPVGEAPPGE